MARRRPERTGLSELDRIVLLNRKVGRLLEVGEQTVKTVNAQQVRLDLHQGNLASLQATLQDLERRISALERGT